MKIKPDHRTNSEDTFRLLRHSVPVSSVMDGAEVGKKVRCISPDHDDQDPSMHVYDDHVYCFSCGLQGDVVKAWGILRGFDKQTDAARDLARAFNIALPDEAGPQPSANGSARKDKKQEETYTTAQVYDRPVYEFRNLADEVVYVQRHKGAYYRRVGEDRWVANLDGIAAFGSGCGDRGRSSGTGLAQKIYSPCYHQDAGTATRRRRPSVKPKLYNTQH